MQRSLLHGGPTAAKPTGSPLLGKGFRPFFLLAAAYAALAMPLWLLALNGVLRLGAYFGGVFWHAHEMLFGFATAVIAGFLLTAIGNWTSRETAVGGRLAGLAGLWVAGRVAVLFADHLPAPLAAAIDLAFLPALAAVCARPVLASRNERNYPFIAMLGALSVANLLMHLDALGAAPGFARRGAWFATHVIILMIVVMSGRIVPMFTRNATGQKSIKNLPRLDKAAALGVLAVALTDLAPLDARVVAALSAVVGALVLARSVTWGTRYTWRDPLLWILHAGHAFVGLGLLLRGAAPIVPALSASAALHALTAGAIGALTLGMMARVSLGHTGRTLTVKPAVGVAFALLVLSALIRVFGPLGGSTAYRHSMITAGVLFALAFALFLWAYVPILISPRVDGRPG